MDSLVLLCAHRVVAHHPLPTIPTHLYPVLFQVAFLDRRPLVLQDLVATWPFTELHFKQLMGHGELLRYHDYSRCVEAIIQGVVVQLVEPGHHSSLRVLDMTGLPDSVSGRTSTRLTGWSSTDALAEACVEVSERQREFQRRGSERHKGSSGAATSTAAPLLLGVDIHADLVVDRSSYGILCNALHTGATGLLRLKCREFEAWELSASEIVTLLEYLDPSCLRRVNLCNIDLGLTELCVILPQLWRFPELRSLKYLHNAWETPELMPESTVGIRCTARYLGMLPCLRELKLRSSELSGNLHQILGDLQAPLESLELASYSLVPADLDFLSQSFHAAALKRLDLSGLDVYQCVLEQLQLLLEKTSASLLHLILMDCYMDDSHLEELLPTLLRCSRLRYLGLCGNSLSTATLKDLLQKTLELPDLKLVVYPYPMDCYRVEPWDFGRGFSEVLDKELLEAVATEISQLLENSGRTDLVWTYDSGDHEAPDYFSL